MKQYGTDERSNFILPGGDDTWYLVVPVDRLGSINNIYSIQQYEIVLL